MQFSKLRHTLIENTVDQEVASLRRKAHLMTGREKDILIKAADKLQSSSGARGGSVKFGLKVISGKFYPDDVKDDKCDYTFIMVDAGRYGTINGKPVTIPKRKWIQVEGMDYHADMISDEVARIVFETTDIEWEDWSDPIRDASIVIQEKSIVSGRVEGNSAYIWGPLDSEQASIIKSKFRNVDTVYDTE